MAEPLILIYHIPKTGGTSLIDYLEKHLHPNQDMIHTEAHFISGNTTGLPWLKSCSPDQRGRIKVAIGHEVTAWITDLFPQRPFHFHTTLREPFSRIASNLNYCLARLSLNDTYYLPEFAWVNDIEKFKDQISTGERPTEFSMEAYLEQLGKSVGWPNFQCNWLIGSFPGFVDMPGGDPFEKAKSVLSHFAEVSTTDRLATYGNKLSKILNTPPFDFHTNKSKCLFNLDDVKRHLSPETIKFDVALHKYYLELGV